MQTESDARRCWGLLPLRLCLQCVARLPQSLLLVLGKVTAFLLWPLLRKRRKIAQVNIDLCFPQLQKSERAQLASRSVRNTVIGMFELVRAWYAPATSLRGQAVVEGLSHLQRALAEGRGVLLLGGHFPPAELCARLLGEALGQPLSIVARRHNSSCLERLLHAARAGAFAQVIDKKDVRGMLRLLSTGGVLAYSADQDFNYQNAFVPFFGVPAATLTLTPALAQRAHAVVLPFWFHRAEDGRYHLRIEPTWEDWPSDDPAADAARYMAALEAVVRAHPEQYLWVHRRFKTRPPGAPPIY